MPFAELCGLTRSDLPREISTGVTLAALMIHLNNGYTQVAGLPLAAVLYADIIPLAVFAQLSSSRHLDPSPDPSMARLVGAALVAFAATGDPLRLQYAIPLALLCALIFFVCLFFSVGVSSLFPLPCRDGQLHHGTRGRSGHQPV